MEELLEILKNIRPNVDFEHCEDLINSGTLDSMDMVMIMTQIMQKFDLSIPPEEMVPENFNSAKAMYRLIQKLEDEE
ncbi:MAG: acyl carrier protein [Oribacterium parvum]|jgi:phosphopantetheine attachment domain protein|uniref:phosphopantetheine-binding protein n=1 Tax=Oribacterium parvum TaxID=1501329 RepID=UPI001CB487EA|nr:phosphopantetheine-binding protein [Oribacterium parvum]MBF1269259.1 acyl carrier protein [Oribacterium parvum]